ncbi:hypothetical protein MKZ38_009914 [Zalerion maritima]|uniref:Maintenance of telomere capping protein 1 n=1 Tax=Zalerion maritima TaxID=339359 RepID=A0AAD5RSV1_9PEZI|nr:hypothetical protein MKZ38_009914 [Zalerion maritima]
MAGRRTNKVALAPVDDELGNLFDGIDKSKAGKKPTPKGKPAASAASSKKKSVDNKDILADLESELSAPPQASSRPPTPKAGGKSSTASGAKRASGAGSTSSSQAAAKVSPAAADPRKSTDSARSYHVAMTPSGASSDATGSDKQQVTPQAQQGGGWWGGIFATASAAAAAAAKQAEGVVSNLQQNEEAKRWADQMKGNVGALRGFGDELRHRAMPAFTNILHTLAPPISQHERLRIHITHDLIGYPSLDPLIYGVFSRVMSQVEGGDLMVIQRGQESTARRSSETGRFSISQAGWKDGPWWRSSDSSRDMGVVGGLVKGTKLCRVSAESYSMEFYATNGGLEKAKQLAHEAVSESNPVRSSDLFLAVQAIGVEEDDEDLFASSAKSKAEEEESPAEQEMGGSPMVCFAVYVLDPVHEIAYSTVSQSIPAKWVRWMDAQSPLTPGSLDEGSGEQQPERMGVMPDEIRDIIESGGVDPREWVSEWVEEALDLSVGIVAQRYVARRMGVGEGGIGKGKQRAEVIMEDGGGEAARAGLI